MAGGASHLDLFDHKPELVKRHGQLSNFGEKVEAFQDGLGPWLRPIWEFSPFGKSGKLLSEIVAPLGEVVDDLAFVHNMVGKTGVHSQGTLLQTTGFNRPGFPGMGCWISYGSGEPQRQFADLRRPARSSGTAVKRDEELGRGVSSDSPPRDGDRSACDRSDRRSQAEPVRRVHHGRARSLTPGTCSQS